MKFRIIVELFVISNLLLVVGSNFNDEIGTTPRLSNEVEEYSTEVAKNHKPELSVAREHSVSQILLENDGQLFNNNENPNDSNPIEEGNKKILRFGKRVFESIQKNGMVTNDIRLLKSGNYQIDWWRHSRRLNGMRNRLSKELEYNPELKFHLHCLGWRNISEQIVNHNTINANYFTQKNQPIPNNENLKNTVMYKMLIMGFDTENREIDAPTKFSLSTQGGFGEAATDFGVIGVINEDLFPNEDRTFSEDEFFVSDRNGQVIMDNDRILQLIPLVVEELRDDQISKEERRAFKWIFGKRLWQLLKREASKRFGETMDHELAKFLLKGELPEPEIARREKHRRSNAFGQKNQNTKRVWTTDQKIQHYRRYKHENDIYNIYYKGIKDPSSIQDLSRRTKN